jgi:hypothetical protein
MMVRPRALGTYVPARFNEPMNPFSQGDGTVAINGMGVYVPANYNEPWNPIVWQRGMGCLGCLGLGQTSTSGFDLSSIGTSLSSAWDSVSQYTVGGIPVVYIALAGGALLLLMNAGGKTRTYRKAAQYQAKAAYQRKLSSIQDQYPGLTARARKALARAAA